MIVGRASAAPIAAVGDFVDLAWPLVVVVALVLLRKPLKVLVDRIGTSASSLSVGPGGVKVDFAGAVTEAEPETASGLADLRSPALAIGPSGAPNLMQQLTGEQVTLHYVVDLGEGREWLSSRLYVFAALLTRMRRTRTLVFVETTNGVRGRFVGVASPVATRFALARAYPWLEADYSDAFAAATNDRRSFEDTAPRTVRQPPYPPLIEDVHGRLPVDVARRAAENFLGKLQNRPPAAAPTAEEAPAPSGWVALKDQFGRFDEHATWLSGGRLERVLGDALARWAYLPDTTARSASDTAATALAKHDEDVVALVDEHLRFKGVIVDRRRALEALAAQLPDPQALSAGRRAVPTEPKEQRTQPGFRNARSGAVSTRRARPPLWTRGKRPVGAPRHTRIRPAKRRAAPSGRDGWHSSNSAARTLRGRAPAVACKRRQLIDPHC